MFSRPDLTREICAVIGVTIGRKHPDWITEAVMKRHPVPPGVDGEFYVFAARGYVRKVVAETLTRAKLTASLVPDEQLVLPGFLRLQKEYLIEEDGTTIAIPIEEMTHDQLLIKADELDLMGEGCHQHAEEIRRYVGQRRHKALG
ncbi:hypothetical protein AAB992_14170 [Burkholderia contaminans]|uniref:hypothetical protein n=1 Tax=Burkholderia contaminans TaxID=488447 RepID=UPI00241606D0|nr:hypothetical protein [Burkholderia contaminans]WFN14380.1 hypothetical protein LXE92_36345 [Burkholderia contaminans]